MPVARSFRRHAALWRERKRYTSLSLQPTWRLSPRTRQAAARTPFHCAVFSARDARQANFRTKHSRQRQSDCRVVGESWHSWPWCFRKHVEHSPNCFGAVATYRSALHDDREFVESDPVKTHFPINRFACRG